MRKNKLMVSLAVSAALAAPLAAHADAGDTTIGGVIYTDFTSVSTTQEVSGAANTDLDPNGIGTDVKRAYFIVNHTFDDIWSANLTTDFNFASFKDSCSVTGGAKGETCTVTTTTPETQLFVKKIYVQGKFDPMFVFRMGSSDAPWIPFAEGVYGYRFVENTLIDRTIGGVNSSFGNSADWGLNASGGNEMVNYSFSIVNGNGYKNPSRSKSVDEEGRIAVTPLDGSLILAAGFYTGKRGQDTEAEEAKLAPNGLNSVSRTDYLIAWKNSGLTVGFEGFTASKWFDVTNSAPTAKTNSSSGTSLYASYDFPGTALSVFGRYDDVKPLKDTDSSMEDKYYNAGVAWKSNSNITWALVYKSDKVTDNEKLGNTTDDLKTQEIGVWAQIKY